MAIKRNDKPPHAPLPGTRWKKLDGKWMMHEAKGKKKDKKKKMTIG